MNIHEVKDAVDDLGRTWTAFQEENNRRTGRNDQALGKMNARMNELETAIRRANRAPAALGEARDYGPEAKAYPS